MRLIKMGMVGIAGLLLMLTVIGLVIPSSVKISRGVVVNADSSAVHTLLADVSNWSRWMPWLQSDSGVLVQQSPVTTETGSYVKWKSLDRKNEGTITLTSFQPGEVGLLHQFKGMNEAKGGFRIRSAGPGGKQTEVQWFLEYPLKWYPWERFYGIFLDHMIGPVLDQALQNLEKQTAAPTVLPS